MKGKSRLTTPLTSSTTACMTHYTGTFLMSTLIDNKIVNTVTVSCCKRSRVCFDCPIPTVSKDRLPWPYKLCWARYSSVVSESRRPSRRWESGTGRDKIQLIRSGLKSDGAKNAHNNYLSSKSGYLFEVLFLVVSAQLPREGNRACLMQLGSSGITPSMS